VLILGNTIDAEGVSNDYVLTMSGFPGGTSRGWYVADNKLGGGIYAVWINGSVIAGNAIMNPTTKECVAIWRRSQDVTVEGNTCAMTQARADSVAAFGAYGAGAADMPAGIRFIDNVAVVTGRAKAFGIRVENVVDVEISGNELRGPQLSAPGWAGIYLRSAIAGSPLVRAVITRNKVSGWGDAAIRVVGNVTADGARAAIGGVEVVANEVDVAEVQTHGLVVDGNVPVDYLLRLDNLCAGTACDRSNL